MDRKLEQKTRYAARNRPIQKPRNETVLRLAYFVSLLLKIRYVL